MVKFALNKLIRDRAPEFFGTKGHMLTYHTLAPQERQDATRNKLLEETKEVLEAQTCLERTEELADLLEVMKALAQEWGLSWSQVEEARAQKALSHGAFDQGFYATSCDIPEDDPDFIARMRAQPDKYPEISS